MKFAGDETLKSSLEQLNVKFKFHTVYLFSDIILILASDSQESLKLTPDSFKRITTLYSENSESGKIFITTFTALTTFFIHHLNL
jgi:hypothetical protein